MIYGCQDGYRRHKCLGCAAEMQTAWWVPPESFCDKCKEKSEKNWGRFYAKKRRGLL